MFEDAKLGKAKLAVMAKGHAPALKEIAVAPGMLAVDIRLGPGRTILGKVVDPSGKPKPGAMVTGRGPWYSNGAFFRVAETDAEGDFSWSDAPATHVPLMAEKSGYIDSEWVSLAPSSKRHTFTLTPELHIRGRVTDVGTAELIQRFRVTLGTVREEGSPVYWGRRSTAASTGGRYHVKGAQRAAVYHVKVEAEGYAPAISRAVRAVERNARFDFKLKRARWLVGVVRSRDGRALAGAEIAVATPGRSTYLRVRQGRWTVEPSSRDVVGKTALDGRFSLPPQTGPFVLVVVHEQGFAEVPSQDFLRSPELTVLPWGRIDGTVRIGQKPAANETISFSSEKRYGGPSRHTINYYYMAVSDGQGSFVLPRVPSGLGWVGRSIRCHQRGGNYRSHAVPADIEAGKTTRVAVGGTGRSVVGRLKLPPGMDSREIRWESTAAYLQRPEIPLPDTWEAMTQEERQAWYESWQKTDQGKAYERSRRSYVPRIEDDGTFKIEDVPSGTYLLKATSREKSEDHARSLGQVVASVRREFVVPEAAGGRNDQPLNLGTVVMTKRKRLKRLKIGDAAPLFEVKTLDGRALKLSDFRGKFVLLDFWATWCGPCVADTPHLKAVYDAYGTDKRFVMIGLSLDKDVEAPRRNVAKNGLKWVQGFLGEWSKTDVPDRYGVGGIPAIFLIGADGKVIATDLGREGIKAAVGKALGQGRKPPAMQPAGRR